MDDQSRRLVRSLLETEWSRLSAAIFAIEQEALPLRDRLGEVTQALEDFGFMDSQP